MQKHTFSFILDTNDCGARLDAALIKHIPNTSRTQIQNWIKNNEVQVNGKACVPSYRIKGGETVEVSAETTLHTQHAAEEMPLPIHYEDAALIIINKPAGLVVHPGAGQPSHTLLNALLHHHPPLQHLPRAGILHRLDKNTTGLMVIAKTQEALFDLSNQLKKRQIERFYQAIVYGRLISGSTIDAPIARHPLQRKKMAVQHSGRPAITHYRVIARFTAFTHLSIKLETGRTHQIRVHCAHVHHPVCGDRIYGGRLHIPKNSSPELISFLKQFCRQALHASQLNLTHPVTQERMEFTCELPEDLQELLLHLKNNEK